MERTIFLFVYLSLLTSTLSASDDAAREAKRAHLAAMLELEFEFGPNFRDDENMTDFAPLPLPLPCPVQADRQATAASVLSVLSSDLQQSASQQ
jgi:hypothetical protein